MPGPDFPCQESVGEAEGGCQVLALFLADLPGPALPGSVRASALGTPHRLQLLPELTSL